MGRTWKSALVFCALFSATALMAGALLLEEYWRESSHPVRESPRRFGTLIGEAKDCGSLRLVCTELAQAQDERDFRLLEEVYLADFWFRKAGEGVLLLSLLAAIAFLYLGLRIRTHAGSPHGE